MEACVQERLHNPQWKLHGLFLYVKQWTKQGMAVGVMKSKNTPGSQLVTKHAMYNQSKSLPLAGNKRMINPSGSEVSESGHQLLPGLCRFVV